MKHLIEKYIDNLSIGDVNLFLNKNNINLNRQELEFTYTYIKKNWNQILSDPNSFNFENYKNVYTSINYNKLNNLINEYRAKYSKYL
jgi:hypothetical protein